jgi:hypothetical protein
MMNTRFFKVVGLYLTGHRRPRLVSISFCVAVKTYFFNDVVTEYCKLCQIVWVLLILLAIQRGDMYYENSSGVQNF